MSPAADKTTGEVFPNDGGTPFPLVVKPSPLVPPDLKTVTNVSQVAGKNPPACNLRDHDELSGMDVYIVDCAFGSGDQNGRPSPFVVIKGFVTSPGKAPTEENAMVIVTGADNVYQRVALAFADHMLPIRGTLRKSGRAWFLD